MVYRANPRLGFRITAARLLDEMEQGGAVSPADGNGPRIVLLKGTSKNWLFDFVDLKK